MYLNLYVYFITIFFKFQYDASNHYPRKDQLLWIDMPWYSRLLHIIKQIPCYILLFLFPFFSSCCPWSRDVSILIYSLIFYTDVTKSCLVIFLYLPLDNISLKHFREIVTTAEDQVVFPGL